MTEQSREQLYGLYIDTLRTRFRSAGLAHLELGAVYWLDEAVWQDSAGGSEGPRPAIRAAHDRGLQVLWIPYYGAGGASRWRELGFDAAWQQANYFFDAALPRTRLDSAVERADAAQMGLELELDKRIVADSASRRRLAESVLAVRRARVRSLAVYDGAGALYELFRSTQPELHAAGVRVADLLCRR